MIAVCFPQEVTIGYDDGSTLRFLAHDPRLTVNCHVPPERVYFTLDETLHDVTRDCLRKKMDLPVILPDETVASWPGQPALLLEFLKHGAVTKGRMLKVCLVNGGGGGLGDGILFAPALDILSRRLFAMTGVRPLLVVYSILPGRTVAVLSGTPGVEVKAMPFSFAEFLTYDAQVDFTGMLADPGFQTMHTTDFVLKKLGIDPETVPAADKEPFLNLPNQIPAEVEAALALARSGGKSLVAIIPVSSYTRTMPEEKIAAIINALSGTYQPVVMYPEGLSPRPFLKRHGLLEKVTDLTPVSSTFTHYFALLAGMDAVVSVDTSAVHIGAALRKPTVALFNSINQEYRIKYSPTVRGIQLEYQGRVCQAPCGVSKSRAFLTGTLPNGRALRFECGYACDEAVDRDTIMSEAIAKLKAMVPTSDVEAVYTRVEQEMRDRLHARLSPCWQRLEVAEVVAALAETMARVHTTGSEPCPLCLTPGRHSRRGRILGVDRYRCSACRADFSLSASCRGIEDLLAGPNIAPTPAEQQFLLSLLGPFLGGRGQVLVIGSKQQEWQVAWHQVLDCLQKDGLSLLMRDGQSCLEKGELSKDRPWDAVLLLDALPGLAAPREVVQGLLAGLDEQGQLVIVTANRQSFGIVVPYFDVCSEWVLETHHRFVASLGLQVLWAGSTPVTWESLTAGLGGLPAVYVQTPEPESRIIELSGRELARPMQQYLARALRNITGHGRFIVSCTRKGDAQQGTWP